MTTQANNIDSKVEAAAPSVSEQSVSEPAEMHSVITTAKQTVSNVVDQWVKFWFEPSDPLMLCVIRLLTAGMLFYNLCVWTLDFEAFFSPNGLQPLATIQKLYEGSPVFSFWLYVSEPWLWPVHFCCLGIVFLFLTGTATRITSVLSYLIAISYCQRVPVANFGLDQVLGLLCLYLAVGPSGACLSVDSWWNRRRQERKASQQPRESAVDESTDVVKSSSARVALRLIQIHLCVIYFWAGFAKLKGDTWFTGEAMWNVIANLEYQTTDLTWLAHVPWLPYLVAHVTVLWELFFCVLVWNRTLRPVMLLVGTGMHIGIGAFLGMWTFGLAMTFCYFAFSSPMLWRRNWSRWLRRSKRQTDASETSSATTQIPQPIPGLIRPPMTSVDAVQPPSVAESVPVPVPIRDVAATSALGLSEFTGTRRGLPGTELLVVALRERHRHSLRGYFRNHDVPCRSVATVDAALSMATSHPPAAVLVMASELNSDQLVVLLEDLQDLTTAPIVAVVSQALMADVQDRRSTVSYVLAPLTLKEIHEELIQAMWQGQEGFSQRSISPRSTGH